MANFSFATGCDETPPIEMWIKWLEEAPPETALQLRQHALSCLSQNVKNQTWGKLIGVAEEILRERGIEFR